MSLGIDRMIFLNQFQTVCTELFPHLFQIIFEQFFENLKIMKGCFIDASLYLSYHFTGCAVSILTVGKQERQEGMPEVPLKSIVCSQLDQLI